jgi:signal transduction histidine kinase
LTSLIEDITDFSKIQLKKFDINNSWFTFQEVTEEVFEMLNYTTQSKQEVQLIANFSQLKETQIFSDRKRIKQVIINLVSNAFKFTDRGVIEVTGSLLIKD